MPHGAFDHLAKSLIPNPTLRQTFGIPGLFGHQFSPALQTFFVDPTFRYSRQNGTALSAAVSILSDGATTSASADNIAAAMAAGQQAVSGDNSAANTPALAIVETPEQKNNKAWKEFRPSIDLALLTLGQIEKIREFAKDEGAPEANEILGYGYDQGTSTIKKNLAKSYRQYARAFLKVLTRVKTNMDVI